MNDFENDRKWEKWCRENVLYDFHSISAEGGRFVFVDKSRCSTILQKRFAVDTVAQCRSGGSVMIEEKMTRYPKRGGQYPKFFLETKSCTIPGYETPGWMEYGQSDILLYGFQLQPRPSNNFKLYLMDFQKLKTWFWDHVEEFKLHVNQETSNHSAGRLVPIYRVENEIGFQVFETPIEITKRDLKRFDVSGHAVAAGTPPPAGDGVAGS